MLRQGEIEELSPSRQEISDLIKKAERRLKEALNEDNYEDTRLELAYLAILFCATASLRASGYRVTREEGHHVRTINTMKYTVHVLQDRVDYYQSLRRARNMGVYDTLLEVSLIQLTEAIEEAGNLLKETKAWLKDQYPELVE